MHLMQFTIRDQGNDSGILTGDDYKAGTGTLAMGVVSGILEAEPGFVPDEDMMALFAWDTRTGRVHLEQPYVPQNKWRDFDSRFVAIHAPLTEGIWRKPASAAAVPPGLVIGQVLLRRCLLPTGPGRASWMMCGIVSSRAGEMPCGAMFDGAGGHSFGGLDVSPSTRPYTPPKPGNYPSKVFEEPNWGWGPEPLAFRSTLRLDVLDKLQSVDGLRKKQDPSPEDIAVLDKVDRETGHILRITKDDKPFKIYLTLISQIEANPKPLQEPVTQAELSARKQLADLVASVVFTAQWKTDKLADTEFLLRECVAAAGRLGMPVKAPGLEPAGAKPTMGR